MSSPPKSRHSSSGSLPSARILQAGSKLGYGLRLVSSRLWDEVLTWAGCSDEADETWYTENVPLVDAYLLGASLFRYPQILGDRFSRGALLEAAVAGVAGESFPLERILSVTRGRTPGPRGSRGAFIRSLEDERIGDGSRTEMRACC